MRKKLLGFILILFAISGWSQNVNQNDYTISINGNSIITTPNFKQQVEGLKQNTSKQSPKTEYTVLQFNKIPSLAEQQKLKEQGVTLLNYLSANAYYAAVNTQFYSRGAVSDNIRTQITVNPSFKLDPVIAEGTIPDYALGVNNTIKVVVSYFKGVDSKTLTQDLANLSVKNIKNNPLFDEVYIETSKEKLQQIATLNWVQNIELIPAPVESDNLPGRTSHKANVLNSEIPGLGYSLTGKGVKVGVWDGNIENHKDFTGRVINREYETNSSHGEHTAGTIGGAGLLDPRAKGMAPEVFIYGWNFNTQSNGLPVYAERELAAKNDGVELTSNSYGINLATGYNRFRYDAGDRGDDNVTVKYTYLLNVYSNGNAQSAYAGGFNTSTKNSKNALHVAANDPNDVISSYSSFGPTIDGRLVPQIAAVGTNVYSLDYSNGYQVMSGTSMATPGVSGTVALLYERYKNTYNTKPLASLMKALVTNTAHDAGNPGPDYKYGFGNINGLRAVKALDNKTFYTASVANGEVYEKEIVVPSGLVSLKVMLAYSDPGTTPGVSTIQVNDLDIKIVKNGVTTLPWVLNPTLPNANATRGVDKLNNIEQITLDNPEAGSYKIIVTGTKVPLDSQEFSVVYDYVAPELILTYPIGREKFNTDSTEYIRWDYEGEPKPFTLEYSEDGGVNYKIIAKDIPSSARNFLWKVPAGIAANAKIRVSAGSKVDVSREVFTIMTEPKNLTIEPAVCGVSSFKLDWEPIAGAKYEVLKMNGYKFDVVATVTDPTYTFENLTVSEDNWFSVRAIDIATGITSERVKAVNVDPVSAPVLNASNLPFKEDFNDRKATNYVFYKGKTGVVKYEFIDPVLLDGAKMAGSGDPGAAPWVPSTVVNAFPANPDYIKGVAFCDIDGTNLAGKAIRLKFNLLWNTVGQVNTNFFRVVVNGTVLKSNENISIYGGTTLSGNKVLTYDLSAYAGTKFSVKLESVINNDFIVVNNENVYSSVSVDNVEIFEATATDLKLSALIPNTGLTASETVTVKVFNNSPVAISNIPVSYKINDGAAVVENIPGPINPLTEITYSFTQKANFSAPGFYTVIASVNYPDDVVPENNSITKNVLNIGNDVLSGSAAVTTCSAAFTDSGTRFGNYADNLSQITTFKPGTVGSSIKVDFTAFDLEEGYDYLYVFNGPTTNDPLLGAFTGATLPPSLSSTAANGELTFAFVSDEAVNTAGWIANISCVEKPTVNDAGVVSIISPEILGKKTSTEDITIEVSNFGPVALTNLPVYYQINDGVKVTDVVPTIDAYSTVAFTFATKADLSTVGATYKIKSGVDVADDNPENDAVEKEVLNKNDLPLHDNVNGFAISKLKFKDVINTSGISGYTDFKNIKIPVYAGFTYQPEVTITKPEAPLTRDITGSAGVFTMIVIDLNGDGNLTDEFYAGNFWVNTTATSAAPAIPSTTSTHYFRHYFTLAPALTIPANTTAGEKLMRIVHMFRAPGEDYNVNLGPTTDGLTSSSPDFEVEEYTINVLPFTAADASVDAITSPIKPGLKPVTVKAVIRNYSEGDISNFPVAYKINGGPEVVETFTGTIPKGTTASYTFTAKADVSAVGDYSIDVYTKLEGDTDPTNDLKTVTFTHVANYPVNVAATFDGVNDYVKTDITPPLALSNNYTFEAWVNQKQPSVFGRILDKSTVLAFIHNNNNLVTYKENSLVLSITTASGSYVLNTGLNSIQQNKWHHVAFSVSATNVYTIYIDGVSVPYTSTGTAAPANNNANAAAFIGNNAGLARGLIGNIDEVRIWSGVRDQATIAANTMTKYIGNEPGLLAYYPFNEGNKQFVFDYSPNDNTAVVTNANTDQIGEGKFWNIPVLLQQLEFPNQLSSSYDAASKTYTILLNDGADVKNLVANFSVGMNSLVKINDVPQISGVTVNDYTNPVTLTVVGVGFNTGIIENYTVKILSGLSNESKLISYTFKPEDNPGLPQEIVTTIVGNNVVADVPYGYNLSNLKASFQVSPGAELYIDNVKQTGFKTTPLDYSIQRIVSVISENKLSQTNYVITLNVGENSEANFISYSVQNQVGTSQIDVAAKTIKLYVNNNATLSSLLPVFQVSDFATVTLGTIVQSSGITPLNYTSPFVYKVTAENGTTVNWTVTIERAKPVITLLGDAVVTLNRGCVYTEPGFVATDNLGTDITASVVVSGIVDVEKSGQYILTYTAKDALNNESSITRTVNVTGIECTLGVDTNVVKGVAIFPNPVTDHKLNIVTPSNSTKKIQLTDVSGKNVFSLQTANNILNLPYLPKGIYVIKVEQDDKLTTQKLIIE
ncbi:S8 family serine peptidase [Flavobacterium sp.]|uniref:S8 family serine peptidase n=1 Tax=Flavobacterium sp. TaxID=239 RepID=UPI002CBEEFCF|nr:S8 family serine peptidase [Flavobacterium sp.]HSD07704.1 S8 family serine peptidase [Flavobacterium sp.]